MKGRSWEFSVGWSCTDRDIDAIDRAPKAVWQNGIDQDGTLLKDTWVADITGLLDLSEWDLSEWTEKIPNLRITAPGRAAAPEIHQESQRPGEGPGLALPVDSRKRPYRQVAWLGARHRSHVHVEDDVKQAKAIGMNRWPSRHWNVNVAWVAMVAMAASLLAAFRHLGLPDGDLRKASISTLRFRLFEVPGRITLRATTWLHLPADWPWTRALTTTWQTIKSLPTPI